MRRRAALLAAVLAVAALLTGCRFAGQLYGATDLRITAPSDSATVTTPLRLSWSAGGLVGPGDSYAVFVDREPVEPDQSVYDLLPDSCLEVPTCPQADYFAQAGTWLAADPGLELSTLPRSASAAEDNEFHSITVVVLDPTMRRKNEAFARVEVVYHRRVV